jgi:hypothetical protein
MALWARDLLTVLGDPGDLRAFKTAVRGRGPSEDAEAVRTTLIIMGRPAPNIDDAKPSVLDFERLVPPPQHLPGGQIDRDWREEEWGTATSARGATVNGTLKSGELRYRFATVYSPPEEWCAKVAAMYPELTFDLQWDIELGQGCGNVRWERGKRLFRETWFPDELPRRD